MFTDAGALVGLAVAGALLCAVAVLAATALVRRKARRAQGRHRK